MKRANPINLNSAEYWNTVYAGTENREAYRQNEKGVSTEDTTHRFLQTLSLIKDGDRVLDIGCGIGSLTSRIKERYPNAEVWGVDISDQAIEENKNEHPGITYLVGNVEEGLVDTGVEYYDVVFSGETLEHLDTPARLFQAAFRALKPGGTLIVTTPREDHITTPEHTWFYSKDDIRTLFTENGFSAPRFVDLPDNEGYYVFFAVGEKDPPDETRLA